MDFVHPNTPNISPPFYITTHTADGIPVFTLINITRTYKYLRVTFDNKLNWNSHAINVEVKATRWAQQLWRISKMADGLALSKTRQLYTTVALPALTSASDIWFIPLFKVAHSRKSLGSVKITSTL